MTWKPFSQRYGYVPVSDVLIRETITDEIKNAIINCFYVFRKQIWDYEASRLEDVHYEDIERYLWTHFLNLRLDDFYSYGFGGPKHNFATMKVFENHKTEWYIFLDLIEEVLKFMITTIKSRKLKDTKLLVNNFIHNINSEFSRLNYAYRIIDNLVVEVNSNIEIQTLETAIQKSSDNVRDHLQKALEHYSERPNPDLRNSIKESISAVEAICRDLTGEITLGKALKKLEQNGVQIHSMLQSSFERLYVYSNDEQTGIRHALMGDSDKFVPTKSEAYYMLVTCSAFVNYLRMKQS